MRGHRGMGIRSQRKTELAAGCRGLAGSDGKAHRQAKRIYDSMKLGAEPTPRAAESLGLRSPLLRRAPAA